MLLFVALPNLALATQNEDHNSKIVVTNSSKQMISHLVDRRELNPKLFREAISQEDVSLSVMALQGLGRIGGDNVLELIEDSLTSQTKEIRRAAVFAMGISGSKLANNYLWPLLENESNELVKQEIYLALGTVGEKSIIKKLLARVSNELSLDTKASIFQALAISLTYHQAVVDDIEMNLAQIDYAKLLSLIENDDQVSYQVGYFLSRIKNVDKFIGPEKLQKTTQLLISTNNKKVLARLIGKVTKNTHSANRGLLSWLIQQSEQQDIGLATEAIRAMGSMLYIPQAKIQLGKLHASSKILVAQTALKTLADSELTGKEINALLKKQLKSKNSGMVVEAMAGLIKRQQRDDMTWALKILGHHSSFVKIRFSKMIYDKDKEGFKNTLKMLSKDKDSKVANFAKQLTSNSNAAQKQGPHYSPSTIDIKQIQNRIVRLETTVGNIDIQLNQDTPYTTLNFLRLTETGFYNDSYFSRVIGDFVAQGGDTVGDGDGSSGETIREEITYRSHRIGTVGMATSGKDTGDSQFFINTADNTHLDRNYTIFGEVIQGMDVALKLSLGDQIISIKRQ